MILRDEGKDSVLEKGRCKQLLCGEPTQHAIGGLVRMCCLHLSRLIGFWILAMQRWEWTNRHRSTAAVYPLLDRLSDGLPRFGSFLSLGRFPVKSILSHFISFFPLSVSGAI